MNVSDVFIAGGMPRVTYNPRSELKLESTLIEYLEDRYKLISITGPTKSGKTVLFTKVIPTDQRLLIIGGGIKSDDDFWNCVLDELDYEMLDSTTVTNSKSENENGSISGELNMGFAKLSATTADAGEVSNSKSKTLRRITSLKQQAIKRLREVDPILVIDDFHYITQEVQQQVVRSLKQLIFEGLRVVILAVPHRAYDALKVETEMTGRVVQLQIALWSKNELEQIGFTGFKELNIVCDPNILELFAEESFGSPNLMQEFCNRLCKINGIKYSLEVSQEIFLNDKNAFFAEIVNSVTSKVAYERLAKGPRQRADRLQRKLKNGEVVDIYSAILHAIAETGPKIVISYEELRSSLKKVLDEDAPKGNEITRVLSKMDEIAKTLQGEPVIDWDKDDTNLFISDPYFAFYLKWAIKSH